MGSGNCRQSVPFSFAINGTKYPEKEDKEVKSHIVKKLKQSWPDLDPSTQITYISTLNATTGQNLGIVTEEFSSLMAGIKSMVLQGIDCRMEMHWR